MRRWRGVDLPRGVFSVKGGRYWYFQARRGRPDRGPLIKLSEPGTPEFWAEMATIEGRNAGPQEGTVDALISAYKLDPKFTNRAEGTRKTYEPALRYIAERWGPLRVDGLTPAAIQAFLDDQFRNKPSMGNLTLTVLRTILKWGVPRGYIGTNPAREIEFLEERGEGAVEWSEEAWRFVVDHGPTELSRLAVLGRATGLRISDLVRLRPRDRDGRGLLTGIKKIGKKEGRHWCPIEDNALLLVIDGWKVFPNATYISDGNGRAFTPKKLAAQLEKFVKVHPGLASEGITAHGLRVRAVCDRRKLGHNVERIGAAIGMTPAMVLHYSRDLDQRIAAGGEHEQNEIVKTATGEMKTEKPK